MNLRSPPPMALMLLLAGSCLAACDRRDADDRGNRLATVGGRDVILVGPEPGPPRDTVQPRNPLGDAPATVQDGRRLFVSFNCSGCHGGHGGGGMGPSLRDERWLYGSSEAQIFDSIASGRAHGMPAWGTMLPESEIWKLTAYIRSLRTDAEPDRPTLEAP